MNFTVTVGRMLTCVLDGFADLVMLAWAFSYVGLGACLRRQAV